jgi:hypothetical protein
MRIPPSTSRVSPSTTATTSVPVVDCVGSGLVGAGVPLVGATALRGVGAVLAVMEEVVDVVDSPGARVSEDALNLKASSRDG